MDSENLVRVDDLLEQTKGTDAYSTVKSIVASLPKIDITRLAAELKEARESIPVLKASNICLLRELAQYRLPTPNSKTREELNR